MSERMHIINEAGDDLFDEDDQDHMNIPSSSSSHMGGFLAPVMTSSSPAISNILNAPKTLMISSNNSSSDHDHFILSSTQTQAQTQHHFSHHPLGKSQIYPFHMMMRSSSANHLTWGAWGEMDGKRSNSSSIITGGHGGDHMNYDDVGFGAMKMKKVIKPARRKVREPRFCFKTMSDVDVLDDGYKWRKYGQKVVKNTQHPRSYYRCTQENCRVKKRVERLAEDPRMVITTYEGRHIHSPSHDDDDQNHSPCSHHHHQLSNFFW